MESSVTDTLSGAMLGATLGLVIGVARSSYIRRCWERFVYQWSVVLLIAQPLGETLLVCLCCFVPRGYVPTAYNEHRASSSHSLSCEHRPKRCVKRCLDLPPRDPAPDRLVAAPPPPLPAVHTAASGPVYCQAGDTGGYHTPESPCTPCAASSDRSPTSCDRSRGVARVQVGFGFSRDCEVGSGESSGYWTGSAASGSPGSARAEEASTDAAAVDAARERAVQTLWLVQGSWKPIGGRAQMPPSEWLRFKQVSREKQRLLKTAVKNVQSAVQAMQVDLEDYSTLRFRGDRVALPDGELQPGEDAEWRQLPARSDHKPGTEWVSSRFSRDGRCLILMHARRDAAGAVDRHSENFSRLVWVNPVDEAQWGEDDELNVLVTSHMLLSDRTSRWFELAYSRIGQRLPVIGLAAQSPQRAGAAQPRAISTITRAMRAFNTSRMRRRNSAIF